MKTFTYEEVAKHNNKDSIWVIINNKIYDLSGFLPEHPGGTKVLLKLAGKDATKDFSIIHSKDVLEELPPNAIVGQLDTNAKQLQLQQNRGSRKSPKTKKKKTKTKNADNLLPSSSSSPPKEYKLPPLEHILNIREFEEIAHKILSKKAWAYYNSGSDDEISKHYNNEIFSKVIFRPRIFRDVEKCDTSTTFVGYKTDLPFYISAAAMARLAHPTGEKGISDACYKNGIIQMISNNASMSFNEIVETEPRNNDQVWFFQLYVQIKREKSERILRKIVQTGRLGAVVLTLDAPVPGKREGDEKVRFAEEEEEEEETSVGAGDKEVKADGGLGKALFAGTSPNLVWKDLEWLRGLLPKKVKIIIKGLGTYEDVELAANHPLVDGVILSNHGGRSIDFAQPPLLVLEETRKYVPHVFDKIEIFIDGGIKRGTDVVKALCLGAKQVGLGRAALYGLAGYGEDGVNRTIQILREEVETAMRLLGVNEISQLGPQYVNTSQLDAILYRSKL